MKKILVTLLVVVVTVLSSMPTEEWFLSSGEAKEIYIQLAAIRFGAANPSCMKVEITPIREERSEKILFIAECTDEEK